MRNLRAEIIRVLTSPGPEIGMTKLVGALSAPRSAVTKLCRDLEREGLVKRRQALDERGKPGKHVFVRPKASAA